MLMKEDWIHWIWASGSFRSYGLSTCEGIPLELFRRGYAHRDAGPDFPECALRLGSTTWAGSVELHVRASDWNRHGHQHDAAYNNVILHVVWEWDADVFREDGSAVPCLELKPLVDNAVLERLEQLHSNTAWLACSGMLGRMPREVVNDLREQALLRRMEQKSNPLLTLARQTGFNWEQVLYLTLAENFGFRTNRYAFAQLAESLDIRILLRHRHHPFQMEALLFGQSGLLQGHKDDYAQLLMKEYVFLRQKYQLEPLQAAAWKFMRMRPLNFPTLRIAQFAALLQHHERLFDRILMHRNAEELMQLLEVEAGGYWEHHYRFGLPSAPGNKKLGADAALNILVNTAAPIMFAYGRYIGDPSLMDRAANMLKQLPAENNRIVRAWAKEGVSASHAGDSQALTGQWKSMCAERACLQCPAGQFLAGCTP